MSRCALVLLAFCATASAFVSQPRIGLSSKVAMSKAAPTRASAAPVASIAPVESLPALTAAMGLEVTYGAYLAVILGVLVPVIFLVILFIKVWGARAASPRERFLPHGPRPRCAVQRRGHCHHLPLARAGWRRPLRRDRRAVQVRHEEQQVKGHGKGQRLQGRVALRFDRACRPSCGSPPAGSIVSRPASPEDCGAGVTPWSRV